MRTFFVFALVMLKTGLTCRVTKTKALSEHCVSSSALPRVFWNSGLSFGLFRGSGACRSHAGPLSEKKSPIRKLDLASREDMEGEGGRRFTIYLRGPLGW